MKKNGLFTAISFLVLIGTFSCTWEQVKPQFDCTTSPIVIELLESNDAGCSAINGSFTVNASGGEPPYSYTTNVGTNTDGVFINVSAASYAVIATDAKGCSVELIVSIQNIGGVNLDEVLVNDAGCSSFNGTIQIAASGGEGPYQFSLNGGAPQDGNVFSSLKQGDYSISVKDQLGCEITSNVAVQSGISYANSVKSIIENNCAIPGCHNGSVSPDLRSFSTIQSRASSIKLRTSNKSMPKGSSLSQQQIDMIACWVDDGSKQN